MSVVAPVAVDEIADNPRVRWHERPYRRGEVASYRLAVTATGDPSVDGQVHWDAEAAGVWLNSADDPERCSFTLPAVSRHDDLQITVSTNGHSPAVAAWLRDAGLQVRTQQLSEDSVNVIGTVRGTGDRAGSERGGVTRGAQQFLLQDVADGFVGYAAALGTGAIPRAKIIKTERKPGVPNAVDRKSVV